MSIAVHNIHKSFGAIKVLNGVSLDFPKGELVALLGPSGCGKTTLLRIIAGLERADEGQIILSGTDASDKDVRERHVGFVFQHYALFRHMTVFENIAFGLRVRPRSERPSEKEITDLVLKLLDLVQLGWIKNRYPAQLSGGQRQRIALARALAVEPQVLLLDEPFGALDAKVRKELRRWLRRLHDELHISSIFVTHDQEEALEVADRVVLMNRGTIEQVGSPRQIYREPSTAFAYSFLGSVNEFRGKIEAQGVRVGTDLLPHVTTAFRAGDDVLGYARPYDIEITPGDTNAPGVAAKVNRILEAGVMARVELVANGPYRPAKPDYFEAELTAADLADLKLTVGQAVRITTRRLQLYSGVDRSVEV